MGGGVSDPIGEEPAGSDQLERKVQTWPCTPAAAELCKALVKKW